jgi:hypothetical protein
MQTSDRSSLRTRMAGVAAATGLAIALTSNWLACTPGDVDCDKVMCGGSGSGGEGGAGGTINGMGGGTIEDPPAACGDNATGTGDAALKMFETKYIATKCGQAKCHGPMSVFPPKMLDQPDMIRSLLLNVKGTLLCKNDYYVDKAKPANSFVLAKITAMGDYLPCPSAPTGKQDAGGTRMPNKDGMPGALGDRLPDGDIECFTWWINNVGKVK